MSSFPFQANGAIKQNRTADLFLTKEVLYLLSYNGLVCPKKGSRIILHLGFDCKWENEGKNTKLSAECLFYLTNWAVWYNDGHYECYILFHG